MNSVERLQETRYRPCKFHDVAIQTDEIQFRRKAEDLCAKLFRSLGNTGEFDFCDHRTDEIFIVEHLLRPRTMHFGDGERNER